MESYEMMWLAEYLKSYDDLLYKAYKEEIPGEEFKEGCRALKDGMTRMQLVMVGVFEMMSTFKILHEKADRWADSKACRQIAWETALDALQKLEAEPIERPVAN